MANEITWRLEHERIGRLLLHYAMPAVIGTMVNALYNIVDRIFIGQGVGPLAMAGLKMCIRDRVIEDFLHLLRVEITQNILLRSREIVCDGTAGRIFIKRQVNLFQERDDVLPVSYTHLDVYKRQTSKICLHSVSS